MLHIDVCDGDAHIAFNLPTQSGNQVEAQFFNLGLEPVCSIVALHP